MGEKTSLVSRAIDAMQEEASRAQVRASLLKYLNTDTIWYVFIPGRSLQR
jgi:ATP synthase mitochondrial F1 complex assembly factor 2